ncbi:MAG: nodulation protein NfeD, partial [Bdellovibrionales bacterium]|nr:nodulation protein NfeD [Bdellovibrionales bacterium]
AKAVSAEEAAKIKAIDFVGDKKMDFLQFAQDRKVKLSENQEISVEVGDLITMEPGIRDQFMSLVTDPQTAYLLFMGSLALIYFEITHPGTFVAGVAGGIGLVISLVALHKLDVQYGGLLLLLIGVALMIAEAFVASFGILGIGGVAAFIAGSLFLFDPETSGGYALPLSLVIVTSLLLGTIMMAVAYMAFRTRNVRKKGSFDDLLGEEAVVVTLNSDQKSGQIEVAGETWRFHSEVNLQEGQKVFINGNKGLTLEVGLSKREV